MPKNQKRPLAGAQPITIILTGGGSGGHITPLLPLARALKAKNPGCRVVYIGLKGDKIDTSQAPYKVFDTISRVSSGKFRRYHGESLLSHLLDVKTLLLNFRDVFKVLWGTLTALRLLGKYRPSVVFSKGGYVAVPVGLAAHIRRIPIVTHDSDAIGGLANKIIGRWAKVRTNAAQVGIPIDENLKPVDGVEQKNLKRQIGLSPDSLMLLVGGAGLGSHSINQLVAKISPQILKNNPSLQIIHLSGSGHQDALNEQYLRQLGEETARRVSVMDFTNDFNVYSGAADVVLARAGATTLAELAIQHKALVVIPSPFLAGGHQLRNADELTTKDAAIVLPNDISPQKLLTVLDDLLKNSQRRQQLAQNIGSLARPEASSELADIILATAKA